MTTASDEVTVEVPARVHLAGNPSDGYGGAVVSVTVPRCAARVRITEAGAFSVSGPAVSWSTLDHLVSDAGRHGHNGGDRLVTAALVALHELGAVSGERRPGRIEWSTSIPRSVGLGGSSAIVLATMRAALDWWEVDPRPADLELAVAALEAETRELGMVAGLADRAVQAIGGAVLTDCRGPQPEARSITVPQPVEITLLWNERAAAPSGTYHRDLRALFDRGDQRTVETMSDLAALADQAAASLTAGEPDRLSEALDASLVLRRRLGMVPPAALEGVDGLRAAGAAVNFAGSGGSLVVLGDAPAPPGWHCLPVPIPA